MNNLPRLTCFVLKYHLDWSKSCFHIVGDPLKHYINFEFIPWDGRNINLDMIGSEFKRKPIVFFQYPPPDNLFKNYNLKLIWIPMWDHVQTYSIDWWQKLPKNLRIIAFSKKIADIAKKIGLNIIILKYYPNPSLFKKVRLNKRVLFYWNRVGLINKNSLIDLCNILKVDILIFQNTLDPKIDKKLFYTLPEYIGKTKVDIIDNYCPRTKYINKLNEANIYIAPRFYEGIGISFIEALSRGCVVLGYDAATMNEYIQHKINGFLIGEKKTDLSKTKSKIVEIFQKIISQTRFKYQKEHNVINHYNWNNLADIDLEKLSYNAIMTSQEGYKIWQNDIKNYASFLLN